MENSKKSLQEQNKLIAQGNKLVEGKYNYSLWELRLFIEMVQRIDRDDTDFKSIKLYFKDLTNEYGKKSNDDYRLIEKAAVNLMRKVVKIEVITKEGEARIFQRPLVNGISTPKYMNDGFDKYIELWFSEEIKPLLLDLKKNYLLYDKRNILNLKSKFAVRMYQLLKSHEREAKNSIVVDYNILKLRDMLLVDDKGNPTKQYKQYGQFETYVIKKAQKELKEHTDISFSFDKIKEGRQIVTLRFYVKKNRKNQYKTIPPKSVQTPPTQRTPMPPISKPKAPSPQVQTPPPSPTIDPVIYQNPAYQKLIEIGVASATALDLIKNYPMPYILKSIQHAQQTHQVSPKQNLAGFIISCIKKGTYQASIQQKQHKRTKAQLRQARLDTHLRILEIFNNKYEKTRVELVEKIKAELNKPTRMELIDLARKTNKRAEHLKNEKIQETIYFKFAIINKYGGTEKFPLEYTSFEVFMEKNYQVKIGKSIQEAWYEIIG